MCGVLIALFFFFVARILIVSDLLPFFFFFSFSHAHEVNERSDACGDSLVLAKLLIIANLIRRLVTL